MTEVPSRFFAAPRLATQLAPGIALSAFVVAVALFSAPLIERLLPNPTMVIALVVGLALHGFAQRAAFRPGLTFCVKRVLRWAVALLGFRIALSDVASLGVETAVMVAAAMIVTILSGFVLARLFRLPEAYGALVGSATGVCGASAALATASVLPGYANKERDVAFVVVGANTLATVAMLLYPQICAVLNLDPHASGVMLGATIHDVAQVVGAGYAMSETTGNTAAIVKLFRVFLLLPVIVAIGWWFVRKAEMKEKSEFPVPVFAVVFLGFCILNSAISSVPALQAAYFPVRSVLNEVSTAGLLLAIGALGLNTSLGAIFALSWRHIGTMLVSAAILLSIVCAVLV